MKKTEHFKPSEFLCPCCGRGENEIDQRLVDMLEKLRTALNAESIIITSGYRCNNHDREVGGSGSGMHTLGGAADIIAYKKNQQSYESLTIAREAEKIGFNGIGIIDAVACHVDIRGAIPYANNHWFGNEITGATYTTFKDKGEEIYFENTSPAICPHCGGKIKIEKG